MKRQKKTINIHSYRQVVIYSRFDWCFQLFVGQRWDRSLLWL